ncbi:MAG: hypothetical protein IKX53_02960 [Bacteroidales bacterium]|nr:hypothetical protein [Bacteroidales bacterium]
MMEDFKYSVSPDNIHLESSFKVGKASFVRELTEMRERHPECLVWKHRTIKSLAREWATHNALYALGIFRSRTSHTDLNWPQKWLIRLGYTLIGPIVWPFIK